MSSLQEIAAVLAPEEVCATVNVAVYIVMVLPLDTFTLQVLLLVVPSQVMLMLLLAVSEMLFPDLAISLATHFTVLLFEVALTAVSSHDIRSVKPVPPVPNSWSMFPLLFAIQITTL
jgi:hypothetical protein